MKLSVDEIQWHDSVLRALIFDATGVTLKFVEFGLKRQIVCIFSGVVFTSVKLEDLFSPDEAEIAEGKNVEMGPKDHLFQLGLMSPNGYLEITFHYSEIIIEVD